MTSENGARPASGRSEPRRNSDQLGGVIGSAHTTTACPLQDALQYAAHGLAVFPCRPMSKEPSCKRGFKDATTNPATLRRWWLANDTYNIAIATGIISRVWVLDVD